MSLGPLGSFGSLGNLGTAHHGHHHQLPGLVPTNHANLMLSNHQTNIDNHSKSRYDIVVTQCYENLPQITDKEYQASSCMNQAIVKNLVQSFHLLLCGLDSKSHSKQELREVLYNQLNNCHRKPEFMASNSAAWNH